MSPILRKLAQCSVHCKCDVSVSINLSAPTDMFDKKKIYVDLESEKCFLCLKMIMWKCTGLYILQYISTENNTEVNVND